MTIIQKNILEIKNGIICQCVNVLGVMGSGLALQIKNKWPIVYNEYKNKLIWPRYKNLGLSKLIKVEESLYVANIASQFDYGIDYRRTEYGSIYFALKDLKNQIENLNYSVYIPWMMASGRGGADWNLIMEMLDELFPDCYICKID